MAVETATKISALNAAWPLGTDLKSEGDNHLRLIKGTLQAVFDDSGTTIKHTLPVQSPGLTLNDPTDTTKLLTINQTRQPTATTETLYAPAANVANMSAGSVWEPVLMQDLSGFTTQTVANLAAFFSLRFSWYAQTSVADSVISMQFSNDNGSTFVQGATDYLYSEISYRQLPSNTVAGNTSSQPRFLLATLVSAHATNGCSGQMIVHGFNKATATLGDGSSSGYQGAAASWGQFKLAPACLLGQVHNALRFQASTAVTGRMIIEGIRG